MANLMLARDSYITFEIIEFIYFKQKVGKTKFVFFLYILFFNQIDTN